MPVSTGWAKGSARALAVAAALSVAGCGEPGAAGGWTTTVDTLAASGAVRVVHTPPADERPTWVIEEELRVGSLEGAGPESFGQLRGLVVTTDGRMAALDAMAQEVRVFGPDGAHLATHGGRGEGPGELMAATGLMLAADDRIWAPEPRGNARMSVFDPTDGFVESFPLIVYRYSFVWQGVMDAEGRILKPSSARTEPRGNLLRVYDGIMVLVDSVPLPADPEGDPEDPPGSFYWEAADGGMSGYYGVPFYPQGQQLLDPRGGAWSIAPGDASYRIAHWTPGGDTTLVIEARRAPPPIPTAERDSAIDVVRSYLLERGAARQDYSKVPEVRPAIDRLFMSDEGRLWVQRTEGDGRTHFDVFERDGRLVGTAVTELSLYRWVHPVVRGDLLWSIVTDELDVMYVVRARLRPAGTE